MTTKFYVYNIQTTNLIDRNHKSNKYCIFNENLSILYKLPFLVSYITYIVSFDLQFCVYAFYQSDFYRSLHYTSRIYDNIFDGYLHYPSLIAHRRKV